MRHAILIMGVVGGCATAAIAGDVVIDSATSQVKSEDAFNGMMSLGVSDTEGGYTIGDFSVASATVVVAHSMSYLQLNARVQELGAYAESYVEFDATIDIDYTFEMLNYFPKGDFCAEFGIVGENTLAPIHTFVSDGPAFTGSLFADDELTYYLKTSMLRIVDGGFGLMETKFTFGPLAAVPLPQPLAMAAIGIGALAIRRRR